MTTTTTPEVVATEWRPRRERVALVRLLRAELRWVFRRPRTLVVLGLLATIPVIIGIALALADGGPPEGATEAPVFVTAAASALALPIGALTVLLSLLLPLTVAMASGDALAGEQANGTLRGWLLAPVGRGRLLAVKAFGVAVVALTAASLVATTGILTGLVSTGADGLFTLSGTTLPLLDGLGRVAIAVGWVAVQLWALGAIALAVSACTEHPMLVVATVLGSVIVSQVLLLFSALDWLHPFLLPASWDALINLVRDPIAWNALGEGTLRAACYLVIGLSLAYARVVTSDG